MRACGAAIGLMLVLAACPSADEGRAPAGDYLRLADQDDVPTLDPARGYDTASWEFEDMLFSTLVDYDEAGQLIAELATEWEVSADQRTYTFHLRADARFTNGRPVEAADIRFGIVRVLDPATRSPGAEFFRGIAGADGCQSSACAVSGIEVLDAHTVRFRLREIDPLFLHKLAMPFAAAVPPEEVARWGEDFARHPVGSGPFILKEWAAGRHLIFVRNSNYFVAGVPRLAGVLRLVAVNDDLAWLKYESGELDVSNIPPAEFPRVRREERYQPLLRRITTMRTSYLGMNCEMAPFSDVRVRRAMNFAVNKEKLLRLINNRGVVAKAFVPPNMPDYYSPVSGYAFDPDRARRLLADAGYPSGFSTTLWVRSDEGALRLAQSVQQDLADVGVRIRIKAIAWGPFLEAVRTADLVPFFSLGWEADFPDPSNFLEVLLHSKHIGTNNNTNYRNPEVDRLLDAAGRAGDATARIQLLEEAEARAAADAPWVFLYHPVTYRIVHSRVRDFELHPLRPPRYNRTWLTPQ